MKRKLPGQHTVRAFVLMAVIGLSATTCLVTSTSHPVEAAQISAKQAPKILPVNVSWAKEIAAHPAAARLSPTMMARINRTIATGKKRMPTEGRRNFIAGVQAMQAKLRRGGFTKAQHDHFVKVLRQGGVSAKVAQQLFNDPIALLTIPVYTVASPNVKNAAGSAPTSIMDATLLGVANPHNTCGTSKSTSPYQSLSGYTLAGNRGWTVKNIKMWCYKKTQRPIPYRPIESVTVAPRWAPPEFSTTNWCIGCDMTVDWHDEYWYYYTPPYPWLCSSRCNYVSKVHFHIKQCFGVGPISQCLSPAYKNWSISVHSDGTFTAKG